MGRLGVVTVQGKSSIRALRGFFPLSYLTWRISSPYFFDSHLGTFAELNGDCQSVDKTFDSMKQISGGRLASGRCSPDVLVQVRNRYISFGE